MAFALKITSSNGGEFDFTNSIYDPPLIGTSVEYRRDGEQGHSHRRINLSLDGFFIGNAHSEIIAKYKSLRDVLKDNTVVLFYNDGSSTVINNLRCYIDGYNEPTDWKQYDGRYSINLHYLEKTPQNNDLGIAASYSSGAGTFTFSPVPVWSRNVAPARGGDNQNRISPGGVLIASEGSINLKGFFQGANEGEIQTQIDNLELSLRQDGILTYGGVLYTVYAGALSVPEVFPRERCDYQVTFKYYTTLLYQMSCKQRFSRLHRNPLIKEQPYCNRRIVQVRNLSGQTVQYDLKVWSSSLTLARSLLATEVQSVLFSDGVELPGGEEILDNDEISAAVSIRKFHDPYILDNLAGSGY